MDTKITYRFFTITEYEKEQDYLREMHNKGWKLVKVNCIGFFTFEKCEPEDVIYQLDYNLEGLEHKEEYVQMFNDCGWEYIQDCLGFTYFRKPANEAKGDEEIFCDDESRLQMIERIFKGRGIPLAIIFFGVVIPQMMLNQYVRNSPALMGIYIALIILGISIFASLTLKYINFKNNIKK